MKKPSSDTAPSEQDKETIRLIESIARRVRDTIEAGRLPNIELPVRGLDNVKYDEAIGYLELGEARKARTLTVNTARSFAQTLRLMATSRVMVESNDFATKREAYYISKNWGECRFDEQAESDAIMDDIEAMASMHGLSREQLRFYPELHGGSVAGRLTVIDRNTATGLPIEIDCANLGSGAYSIPRSVEHLSFRTDARFILAIETGGMFQRLTIIGFGRPRIALSSKWAACRRAPPGGSFACSPTNTTCPFTASWIATRTASRIFTERSRRAPGTRLMSIASYARRGRVSSASRHRILSTFASRTRRTR